MAPQRLGIFAFVTSLILLARISFTVNSAGERKLAEFTTKVDYKLKTLERNVGLHKKLGELEEKFNERLKEQHRAKVKEDMTPETKKNDY